MSGGGDGLPLGVESRGEEGRPLLLLHGFGAHAFTWRHWVPELEAGHRLLLVDLKGHGAAPKPSDDAYAPTDQAALVERLVLERDLDRVTLVGHSLGGGVALLAALRLLESAPGRVDSLVLISAASLPQEIPRFIGLARIPVLAEALLALVPPEVVIRAVLRSIVYDPEGVEPAQVEAYAAPLRSRAGRRALLASARRIVPPDVDRLVAAYPSLDVPTLLLWGRHDAVVPVRVGRALADLLPRARLRILEACGHLPQEEVPGPALAPVRAFLEGRRAGAGP